MYFIFWLTMAAVLFSFRKTKRQSANFDKDVTLELRGIAILMVLLGHFSLLMKQIHLPVTSYLGAQGVEIFLFLSGFGLVCSYHTKGLSRFVVKRLSVVLIPFAVFNIGKLPVLMITGLKTDLFYAVLNFFAVDVSFDPTMWYIQFILLCYLLFYLIFSQKAWSDCTKAGVLCAMGLVMTFVMTAVKQGPFASLPPLAECWSHQLSFPLGVLFSAFYSRVQALPSWMYASGSAAGFLGYLFFAPAIPASFAYYAANLSFLLFVISLFLLLSRGGYTSVLLRWLGDIAYEIYLNEYFVMLLVARLFSLPGWCAVLLCFGVSVLLALGTKRCSNWILSRTACLTQQPR